ncbi:ABC transporter ATP-binding protein [Mesoaciditoga lauensis]|uniref:ABC transporter ATP-binding protein n=1 Tax=Mesoaciditoga lauensis TaxID=1495039 RepID=UPI00056D1923|nr:ABC transporter ATP-binding protein [Mesoaciditoga lauensis]
MGTFTLKVQNLSKKFGKLSVIEGWSFDVKRGEKLTLFGPSGCGKTTFLRIVSGLEKPTFGEIQISSQKIGMVFQEPTLIPWKNVIDNLRFVRKNDEKIRNVLKKMNLSSFETYFPSSLSGGMKQRVNLARALLVNPDLLILDEPFFSLDLATKMEIMKDIKRMHEKIGFTLLMVTHDVKEAIYISDRIILLSPRPSHILKEFPISLKDEERDFSHPSFITLEGEFIKEILSRTSGV